MKYLLKKHKEFAVMNDSDELIVTENKRQRLFDESEIVTIDKYYSSDDKSSMRNEDMIVFKRYRDYFYCLFRDLTLINNNQMKVSI